ncbi:MAG TPA: GNAT family N-acetyltransferase [Gaiellales bacterium]|nr:GNAT family N-acetyltransferase [Gaiellales bacterium]
MTPHPLAALLEDAARGRFPDPDGQVELLPAAGAAAAVVGFTAHYAIAADVPEAWLRERLPAGDLLAPLSAPFLAELGRTIGRRDDGIDVVLAAAGLDGEPALTETGADAHPRAARAFARRDDVRVFECDGAVVTFGRGLAGRAEVSIEVEPRARGRGVARRALVEARKLVGPGGVVFAQVAPGNAASLRAFLRAGFEPIGSEALFL